MLPRPLIFEIITYLDIPDLLSVSLANRNLNKAANSPCLWKREFFRHWIPDLCDKIPLTLCEDLNTPDYYNSNWKALCIKGLQLRKNWLKLSGFAFSSHEALFLYNEFTSNLKAPIIPFPALRRDLQSFPTILQDLLGNPEDQFIGDFDYEEYTIAFANCLREKQDEFYAEIGSISDLNLLTSYRWNISNIDFSDERLSIESSASKESSDYLYNFFPKKQTKSVILNFFENIQNTLKFFCEGTAGIIAESEDAAYEYCNRWTDYCASMKTINGLFLPLTELMNEIYESKFPESPNFPRMNLMRIMAGVWRRHVFEKTKEKIVASLIKNVNYQRKKVYEEQNADMEACDLIKSLIEAVMDISLNELNVYFKNHSQVNLEGPYSFVNSEIILESKEYYNSLNLPVDTLMIYFENEHNFCTAILPQSTVFQLKMLKYKKIQTEILKVLTIEIINYTPQVNSSELNKFPNALSSGIGEVLLQIDENPLKIADFLLNSNENIEKFDKIQQLIEDKTKSEEDEVIERRANMLGVRFDASPEEIMLYSFSKDINFTQMSGVLKAFSIIN